MKGLNRSLNDSPIYYSRFTKSANDNRSAVWSSLYRTCTTFHDTGLVR